jgi:hypothetical protein
MIAVAIVTTLNWPLDVSAHELSNLMTWRACTALA